MLPSIALIALLFSLNTRAESVISQADSTLLYNEIFLDTVQIQSGRPINDYSMLGVQYGYSMCRVSWNPQKKQESQFLPVNVGVYYTKYGKMFNYMPYFGFKFGLFYAQEGYRFQQNDSGSELVLDLKTKESSAVMTTVEVPFLAHMHVDFWKMKIMADIGLYGGYRLSIDRRGNNVEEAFKNSFTDYNNRWDYGLKGGAGIGFVFDPIEIHLMASVKYSMSSLYRPDYNSPYYYRFAYPYNFIFSVGIHYQLTKREGRTNKELRDEARRRFELELNEIR